MNYTTKDGDIVDEIIWRAFGSCNDDMINAVFDANKCLADVGAILPAGIVITIPDLNNYTSQSRESITLWD